MTLLTNPVPGMIRVGDVEVGLTDDGRGTLFAAPSRLPGMGASLNERGCTFRVWAPFADEVFIAGDFTNPQWDAGKLRLQRDADDGPGRDYWSAFVLGVKRNAKYKFVIKRSDNPALLWRCDPYGRSITGSDRHAVVGDPNYDWGNDAFQMPPWNEMVIYELHVGTFNDEPGGPVGTFKDIVEELDYLRDLGVNAIKVLPASEFSTDTSMGYNPALPFAIETAYGDPDSVKDFVKAAHARGIAVIFDVVYNHLGPEGIDGGLGRFDGWALPGKQGIYFYGDDRSTTPWSADTRPDFGRPQVRQFLRDNAMMWLHEYRADGLRLDSTINIRHAVRKYDDLGEIPEGWWLLQWIANDKNDKQPWKTLIAEDLQNNEWMTKSTGAGGAGCDSQWDSSFFHAVKDALVQSDDAWRDVGSVRGALYNRYNGDAFQRVIYTESHDEVTVQNGRDLGRMTRKIDWNHAEGWHARKRSTLGAALVFTAPGIPMIFQGQELLEWQTWTDKTPLDWKREVHFAGILNLYRDLIKLRRNWYGNTGGLRGQHVNVFHVNYEAKVIAFHRWSDGGAGDDVVVVANFADRRYDAYNIGFPRGGTWFLRFNSDWQGYASDFGNAGYDTAADGGPNQGMPYSGNVGIGPYSAIILSQ